MDKDLNISSDTIKVLEENTVRKISDIPHSHIFTDMSPRAKDIKKRKKTSGTSSKYKAFAWQKKTSAKWNGNQPYGKTYLPMIPQTRV